MVKKDTKKPTQKKSFCNCWLDIKKYYCEQDTKNDKSDDIHTLATL